MYYGVAACEILRYCPMPVLKHISFVIEKKIKRNNSIESGKYLQENISATLFYAQLFSSVICCYKNVRIKLQPNSTNPAISVFYSWTVATTELRIDFGTSNEI